jgi:hypothetical protein
MILCSCLSMMALPAVEPVEATAGITLAILPSTNSVTLGDTFDFTIQANTGSQEIDAAGVYITFDPTKLAITTSNTLGTALPFEIENVFSNNSGTANISCVTLTAPFPSGIFTVVTLHFRAVGVTTSPTTISFNTIDTALAREGIPHLDSATSATIMIISGTSVEEENIPEIPPPDIPDEEQNISEIPAPDVPVEEESLPETPEPDTPVDTEGPAEPVEEVSPETPVQDTPVEPEPETEKTQGPASVVPGDTAETGTSSKIPWIIGGAVAFVTVLAFSLGFTFLRRRRY